MTSAERRLIEIIKTVSRSPNYVMKEESNHFKKGYMAIFARRLRKARERAKLRQCDLSEKAGVTAATISAYESYDGSKGKRPSLDNALKLATALNVSLDWLCGQPSEFSGEWYD